MERYRRTFGRPLLPLPDSLAKDDDGEEVLFVEEEEDDEEKEEEEDEDEDEDKKNDDEGDGDNVKAPLAKSLSYFAATRGCPRSSDRNRLFIIDWFSRAILPLLP